MATEATPGRQRAGPPRIIVALDYPEAAPARRLCEQLDPARCRVKIGKELFVAAGPALVEHCQRQGFDVFLDLKFHDIPTTVAGACRAASRLGVWMLNVHASGGTRMLELARETLDRCTTPPLLVAVTVLTSLTDADLARMNVQAGASAQVRHLARISESCGLDGVVCSARELVALDGAGGPAFLKVTPGIRGADGAADDHRRIMAPAVAIRHGATHLVVGRPVTAARDPEQALESLEIEVERGRR